MPPEFSRTGDDGGAPDGSDLSHGGYVNICGTSVQASKLAPPSPYPLPLASRGRGDLRRRPSPLPPRSGEGEGRERAAQRLQTHSGDPIICVHA
jgi:hypothetical protein